MEKLVKELKENFCLDFELQEVQEIREATEEMVRRFTDAIAKVNPLFEVKALVPCGSMAEGTRTWKLAGWSQEPVIESDFLAVLKNPSQEEITTIKLCNGFLQVIDENDRLKHYYNKFAAVEPENALQVESIDNAFQTDLLKAMKTVCDCVESKNVEHVGRNDKPVQGCEKCTEHKQTGYLELANQPDVCHRLQVNCSLGLKWTSQKCSLRRPIDRIRQTNVYILVNILPSFQNTSPNNAKISVPRPDCFLVPKPCATRHPTCWKVSYCVSEIQMLEEASLEHRLAFMVVKYMAKCLFSAYHKDGSCPSTYKVKTAALHHVRNCTSKPDLTNCVKQILQDLTECYASQTLTHAVSGLNLLAANKTDSLPTHNMTWHRHRCQIISDCFSFISQFFHSSPASRDLSLQNAVKILQFVGRVYQQAWRQTEIEPVYEVNKKKLIAKITIELTNPDSFPELPRVNYADFITKCACPNVHWTKKLKVWEYAPVREMYLYHRFDCPDPPGKSPGREENILLQAQMNCDFFSMAHEDRQEWLAKLDHSENPDDIVAALKAVDMYSGVEKVKKPSRHNKTLLNTNHSQEENKSES